MFTEVCIYEARVDRQDEIEDLMREVAAFYSAHSYVVDVRYVKRTHRQESFRAVKEGKPPVRLTRLVGKVTYVLVWVVKDEEVHAELSKAALEKYYTRWNRCLVSMPKIILGEDVL